MPPPEPKRPYGAIASALLPVTTECSSDRLAPASLTIPPPLDCAPAAWVSRTTESIRPIVPQLSMPAAPPTDAGHGPVGHSALTLGTVWSGVARLPATTVRSSVTVEPGRA